ncbi:hypothetical protein TNCV_2888061 [Trichonephila clavipes]|nr:hypothetical protein TNCV_2888061 [Trichonephila clavipes]
MRLIWSPYRRFVLIPANLGDISTGTTAVDAKLKPLRPSAKTISNTVAARWQPLTVTRDMQRAKPNSPVERKEFNITQHSTVIRKIILKN